MLLDPGADPTLLKISIDHVAANMFIVDVDDTGRFRFSCLNARHEELTGISNAELAGKTPDEVLPPEMADAVIANYARCVAEGGPISYRESLALPGGARTWSTTLLPVLDTAGRIFRIIGTASDVTQEVTRETELESARAFNAAIVRDLEDGVLRMTPGQILTFANERARDILSPTQLSLIGGYLPALLGDVAEPVQQALQSLDREAQRIEISLSRTLPDGGATDERWSIRGLFDPGGRVLGYQVVIRDVTEWTRLVRKQAEEDVRLQMAIATGRGGFWSVDLGTEAFELHWDSTRPGSAEDITFHGSLASWLAMLDPVSRESFSQTLGRIGDTQQPGQGFECLVQHAASDRARWILLRGNRVSPDVRRDLVVGIALDVTENQVLQQQLVEMTTAYRRLFEVSHQGFVIHRDMRALQMNDAFAHVLGFTNVNEAMGDDARLDNPWNAQRIGEVNEECARALAGEIVGPKRVCGQRRDGSSYHAIVSHVATKWQGTPAVLTSTLDISEQQAAFDRLRQREARLRRAEDLARLGHFERIHSGDWQVSEGFARLVRGGAGPDIGMQDLLKILAPADLARLIRALDDSTTGDETLQVDLRRRDQEIVHAEIHVQRSLDPETGLRRVAGVVQDVTERRRISQALESRDRRLSDAFETGKLGELYFDALTGELDWSASAHAVHGTTPETFTPTLEAFWNRVHPDDRATVMGVHGRLVSGVSDEHAEARFQDDQGDYRDILYQWQASFDNQHDVESLICLARDVSAERRAERQIEAMVRDNPVVGAALDNSPILMAITTADERPQRIAYVNAGLARALGIDALEIVGHPFTVLLVDDHQPDDLGQMLDQPFLASVQRADGSVFQAEFIVSSFGSDLGRRLGYVCLIRDVSERIQKERHRRQREKMAALGTLSGHVAHELNNLLQPVLILGETAAAAVDDADISDMLETIADSARAAGEIVNNILTFSRQDTVPTGPIVLGATIEDQLRLVRRSVPTHVHFNCAIDDRASMVMARDTEVLQILINLVQNAVDAVDEGGQIDLTVERIRLDKALDTMTGVLKPGDYLRVAVRDDGIGMDEETVARSLEPFFSNKAAMSGTGLGLPVVYGLVNGWNGAMDMRSAPGVGTEVGVYLPRCPDA